MVSLLARLFRVCVRVRTVGLDLERNGGHTLHTLFISSDQAIFCFVVKRVLQPCFNFAARLWTILEIPLYSFRNGLFYWINVSVAKLFLDLGKINDPVM